MKEIPLAKIEDRLAEYIREAEDEEILITLDGRPAGVLIGLSSADDWAEYQLLNEPRFLRRIEHARKDFRAGRGVRIEDLPG